METPLSVEAAMSWRAVNGCTTVHSKYNFEGCDLGDRLIGPISMMATQDLLDRRSDTAAGNQENGVSVVYGLGPEVAFHTRLEALLKMILTAPRFGMYDLLRSATEGAGGLKWAPKPPPSNYKDGEDVREWGRLWSDQFIDRGLMQEAVSWFQYLILSGKIWPFDVLADPVNPVDDGTDWV